MYFNGNKNNTNIDNEFNKKNNILSLFVNFFSKYKKIILIGIVVIVLLILMLIFFMNRKITNYLILNGDEIVTIYQGSDYIEPGYMAYNSKDEDLTGKVTIESNLNNDIVGEYEIIYKIGEITKTRIINVIDKPQEYTFIHRTSVNNSVDVYLKKGEKYIEPGYQAFNTAGIDLTDKVKVIGEVDTSKKGVYKLTYSVVDSNGVTISVSRKVIVMDSDISLTLDTEKYTNKEVTINVYVIDEYFDYMILPDNTKVTTKTYSYKVSSNGTYTFKVYNKKGNTKESSIKVNNIDKEKPSGSCSGSYEDGLSTINVSASDNVGIDRYMINGKSYTSNKITINSELKTANITIYDKAGNNKNVSCNLKEIKQKTYYQREFSVKYYDSNSGSGLAYWLYIPEGASDNMPLVVYLHGSEGKGNDYKYNTKLAIQYGPGSDVYHKRKEYNAIMIMPQTPTGLYLNMEELMELIDYVADTYKINKNKISLSGMSEGANQIASKIGNYASYFSSIVLLGNYVSNPDKFVSVPVITMCGELDSSRNYSMQNFVKKVNELGGNAKHYTIAGIDHNIVSSSYSVFRDDKYNLVDWMTSQTNK